MTAFFCVHYGIFWIVHGMFVWLFLPLFAGFAGFVDGAGNAGVAFGSRGGAAFSGVRGDVLLWGRVALLVSHVASFLLNYVGRREYLTRSVGAQMAAPYGRVVILHFTILLGALLASFLGQPIGALVVLVGLKTVLDLWLHLREHRPR